MELEACWVRRAAGAGKAPRRRQVLPHVYLVQLVAVRCSGLAVGGCPRPRVDSAVSGSSPPSARPSRKPAQSHYQRPGVGAGRSRLGSLNTFRRWLRRLIRLRSVQTRSAEFSLITVRIPPDRFVQALVASDVDEFAERLVRLAWQEKTFCNQ